jgi:hypothetical protein
MNIEMKLTVPAVVMTGIGGGVWPFFSHKVCTFGFAKSIILVINEKNM